MLQTLRNVVGIDEGVLVLGLILLACGFQRMPSWGAGSFLAPGLVLVWMSVPARSSFLRREPTTAVTPRKRQ